MGYIGFRLGFGSELGKLAGLLAGFFVSFRYYQQLGDWLAKRSFLGTEAGAAVAMGVLVLALYLLVTRILVFFQPLVQVTFEKRVDRIGGLMAGLVRGLLVASVILVACQQLPSPYLQRSIGEYSLSGGAVWRLAPAVYDALNAIPGRLLAGGNPPATGGRGQVR